MLFYSLEGKVLITHAFIYVIICNFTEDLRRLFIDIYSGSNCDLLAC